MYATALDSFVQKFHQLWQAGHTAHLDLDTLAGKAWVGLRVQLGDAPDPVRQQAHHHHPFPPRSNRRSPSYWRRQERRRQEAASAAAEISEKTSENLGQEPSETVTADEASNTTVIEEISDNIIAEKAITEFSCEICDFVSNWENGLSIHMSRIHKDIEQLDGSNDFEEDEKYLGSSHYWKNGYLGTVYQSYLDASDIIEMSDLTEEDKLAENAKLLQARKTAFGPQYKYYPPWRPRLRSLPVCLVFPWALQFLDLFYLRILYLDHLFASEI